MVGNKSVTTRVLTHSQALQIKCIFIDGKIDLWNISLVVVSSIGVWKKTKGVGHSVQPPSNIRKWSFYNMTRSTEAHLLYWLPPGCGLCGHWWCSLDSSVCSSSQVRFLSSSVFSDSLQTSEWLTEKIPSTSLENEMSKSRQRAQTTFIYWKKGNYW